MHSLLTRKSPNGSDELYTPELAARVLLEYLPGNKTIWESSSSRTTVETQALADTLKSSGHKVIQTSLLDGEDFFKINPPSYDIQVTNPPYKIKDLWLERCYELGKPFALLLPTTSLEGMKRGKLFKKYGVQVIIPNRRFYFRKPGEDVVKQTGGWYHTSWFCYGLDLPNDLNFIDIDNLK